MSGDATARVGFAPRADGVRPAVSELPSSILLWDAAEVAAPPAAPCCLRTTVRGDRAVVYRTGPGGGVVAVADALADARPRPDGGWWAPVAVHRLASPLSRAELLADEELAPVFRHLRGRRRLPAGAAARLAELARPDTVEPVLRFWHSRE
ncbi:hypothetical protein WIS52_09035 [Pseudonocardia nematodicida]|uniref:Uncharacterized protein n=1 Tax=Pseudonocardia nematodicida TaxID=1206997 RepID=A0ABV1K8T4_9PSEU